MKIQLFVPPQGYVAQRWTEQDTMPPLGILSLATVLKKEGHEVDLVPADVLHYRERDIENRIRDFGPRMVGVTTCTENRFDSFRLARVVKSLDPRIKTVLGGPHISMSGTDTLEHIPEVDILVHGEGEATVVELARMLENGTNFQGIRGISFRDADRPERIIQTQKRNPIMNLDTIPIPDRSILPMDRYRFTVNGKRAYNIMTSRGCPFQCYFCATPVNWGRRMRGQSPRRVLKEIETGIEQWGVEHIWFYDDTFNYDKKRVHEIMDLIIQRNLNITFTCEFRIDLVDEPLLEKMKRAGLENGCFGVEAGNAFIRREVVGKKFDINLAYRFLRWSRKYDFTPYPFFIFSHYGETWENALETIDIIEKTREINPGADISTAILHVYPGTPLEAIARRERIIPRDFSWARRSDMRRTYVLPAGHGDVPLFKHRMSWSNIADLVMRWSYASSKKSLTPSKIIKTLKSIRSLSDIRINLAFFISFLKARFLKKPRRPSSP